MRVIRAADCRRMPWKNGLGETVEIAVFPQAGALDGFDWRVSRATVGTDGPFSRFPGIDRTLSILDGRGMRLAMDGQAPDLLTADSAPLPFAGDVETLATLVDGPITDLNVMTRRGRYTHAVERLHLDGTAARDVRAGLALVYCHAGAVELRRGEDVVALGDGDSAVADAGTLQLVGTGTVFLVQLEELVRSDT